MQPREVMDRSDAVDQANDESRLRVTVPAAVDAERAAQILGPGRDAWLGELVTPASGPEGTARHLLDLELRVTDAAPRVAFHKAALVDVGPLRRDPSSGAVWVELSWRAATLTPLFPVFAGTLRWEHGQLKLDGYYAPPGGAIGVMADRLLLNVAARATGRRLLERIAEAMARPVR
ncbi:MAG TPA: hypothetical protein VFH63_05180 [candidate division Zixibacteria bacterium]|nr:hypothetical protein [candidate division Zixibacteria bacterium]